MVKAWMERAIGRILKKHRETDMEEKDIDVVKKEKQYIQTLRRQIKKISKWLNDNDDKPGKTGKPRKSNITDNDSAKMKTSSAISGGLSLVVPRPSAVYVRFAPGVWSTQIVQKQDRSTFL